MEIAIGELDKAIDTLTRLMTLRKALLKTMKQAKQNTSEEKRAAALSLKMFGEVLMQKEDRTNAERAFGDALRLFKKLKSDEDESTVKEIQSHLQKLHAVSS